MFKALGISLTALILVGINVTFAGEYDPTINVSSKDDFVPSRLFVDRHYGSDGKDTGACFKVSSDRLRAKKGKSRLIKLWGRTKRAFGSIDAYKDGLDREVETPYQSLILTAYSMYRDYQQTRKNAYIKRNNEIKAQERDLKKDLKDLRRVSSTRNFPFEVSALINQGIISGKPAKNKTKFLQSINIDGLSSEQLHNLRIMILKQYVTGGALWSAIQSNDQNPDKNKDFVFSKMRDLGLLSEEFVEWKDEGNGYRLVLKDTERYKRGKIDNVNYLINEAAEDGKLQAPARGEKVSEKNYFTKYKRIPPVNGDSITFDNDICERFVHENPESVFAKSYKNGYFQNKQIVNFSGVEADKHCEEFVRKVVGMNLKSSEFCDEVTSLKKENETMANCKRAYKSGGISELNENQKDLIFYLSKMDEKNNLESRLSREHAQLERKLAKLRSAANPNELKIAEAERRLRLLDGRKDGSVSYKDIRKERSDKRKILFRRIAGLRGNREHDGYREIKRTPFETDREENKRVVRELARRINGGLNVEGAYARMDAQEVKKGQIVAEPPKFELVAAVSDSGYNTSEKPIAGYYVSYGEGKYYMMNANVSGASWEEVDFGQISEDPEKNIEVSLPNGEKTWVVPVGKTGRYAFKKVAK